MTCSLPPRRVTRVSSVALAVSMVPRSRAGPGWFDGAGWATAIPVRPMTAIRTRLSWCRWVIEVLGWLRAATWLH